MLRSSAKIGVTSESELEFLEEDNFKKLSLKPVSREKWRGLLKQCRSS